MAFVFAITLFLSAFLLFLAQPMIGKMVLPLLGGAPAAWATCMVFFQALLLAGYAYSHVTSTRFGTRRQSRLHLLVLVLPLIAFGVCFLFTGAPIHAFKSLAPQGESFPFFSALILLTVAIGLPFFVVSTSAPLLQRWFADTDHPAARDPYFLYAASNLGSLLALLCYPFLMEPRLRLAEQAWTWTGSYLLLAALIAGCAGVLRGSSRPLASLAPEQMVDTPPKSSDRIRWLLLAFVPSTLLLSVTSFITTDLAPIPMLWVIPLALYLLTFIIAFSRTPLWMQKLVETVTPVTILMLIFMLVSGKKPENWGVTILVHMAVFLLAALNCNMELARRRPVATRLTEYYLWISLGGVLGGLFNSLIAPLVFNDLHEYPLALIAACFLQPSTDDQESSAANRWLDFVLPAILGVGAYFLLRLPISWLPQLANFPIPWVGPFQISNGTLWIFLVYGLPVLICYAFVERPIRFGLAVLIVWLLASVHSYQSMKSSGDLLLQVRSYFGVIAVQKEDITDENEAVYHKLVHGTTLHGMQQFDPPSDEPLTYYHRTGPIGQVFMANPPGLKRGELGFIGLGTGALAAYGQKGQNVTFFEIDRDVKRIAEDPRYFTYLKDCKAKYKIVLGDARLKMEEVGREGQFGLIAVDAFSSDAIPMHLLTLEAVQMYLRCLAPDGIIAIHISNRYLNLEPIVARIAAELNLVGWSLWDTEEADVGKRSAHWIVIARHQDAFGKLTSLPEEFDYNGRPVKLPRWQELKAKDNDPLWTDDISSLSEIFDWTKVLPWAVKKPAS